MKKSRIIAVFLAVMLVIAGLFPDGVEKVYALPTEEDSVEVQTIQDTVPSEEEENALETEESQQYSEQAVTDQENSENETSEVNKKQEDASLEAGETQFSTQEDPAANESSEETEEPGTKQEDPLSETEKEEQSDSNVSEKEELSKEEVSDEDSRAFEENGIRTFQDDFVTVTAEFDDDAGIPKEAQLRVKRIDKDGEGEEQQLYQTRYEETQQWLTEEYGSGKAEAVALSEEGTNPEVGKEEAYELKAFELFDISFVVADQESGEEYEIEPQSAVKVGISFNHDEFAISDDEEEKQLVVGHFTEDGIEVPEMINGEASDDGSVEAEFTTDSFSQYAVIVAQGSGVDCQVWFDGTDGLGTQNSLYQGATNVKQGENGSRTIKSGAMIKLPDSAGNNSKYTLNGWYDIVNGKYYKPGDSVRITDNTVFYAEWVQTNYNLGPASSVVENQPDISSFVTTDVFDYNEIYNAAHGAVIDGNVFNWHSYDRFNWVLERGHLEGTEWVDSEKWKDSRDLANGKDFLFTNWYYFKFGQRWIAFPNNTEADRNSYANNVLTQGIIDSRNEQLMQDLFETQDAPGKKSLGEGDWLYQYDENVDSNRYGYYYYDSEKNAADYNQAQQRFYVYDRTQKIVGDNGLDNGKSYKSFMPFEEGTSNIMKGSGQTNFWFGMHSTIDFFLPDNSGSGGNKAIGNKDMEFYFSGDDDVWVFVDDQLVLDLGGIHQRRAGSINFSTGKVSIQGTDEDGNPMGTASVTDLPFISAGDHKLHFYYLERGSSWSNASIYFNIAPRYSLDIDKMDADDPSKKLENAEFSVYLDEKCTIPAVLWDDEASSQQSGTSKNTFVTDSEGKIHAYGLTANRTYYLKETSSPTGYPAVQSREFVIQMNEYGEATFSEIEDGVVVGNSDRLATFTQNSANKQVHLNICNKKPPTTQIKPIKNWYREDGSVLTEHLPEQILVKLYRATFAQQSGTTPTPEPEPTPTPKVKIPVMIDTQYFDASGTGGNGANQDTAPICQGDLKKSLVVTQGGKLVLTLNTRSSSAAIYSVTVNGKRILPDSGSVTSYTDQNMQIGGRWEQYPPRNGTYTIDPVNERIEITITLIGYINYKPNSATPSLSETLTINTAITDPPADSGTEGGSEAGNNPGEGSGESGEGNTPPVIIPSEKPVNAELVTVDKDGNAITDLVLNASNNWGRDSSGWTNLPTTDENGNLYYYYVEENPRIPGFSISYSGNGTLAGTITVNNVQEEIEVPVEKVWSDGASAHTEDSIVVELLENGQPTGKQLTLCNANNWKGMFTGLSRVGANGEPVTYTVRELAVDGYTTSVSGDASSGFVITNEKKIDFSFTKADSADAAALQGAKFSLYKDNKTTQIVAAYDNEEWTGEKVTEFTSGADGRVFIGDLEPGTYYLKETEAATGYSRMEVLIKIVIDEKGKITSALEVIRVDKNGNETLRTGSNQYLSFSLEASAADQGNKIVNYKLYELPSTGRPGTYLYTICGVAILFANFLLFIKDRRRRKTENR